MAPKSTNKPRWDAELPIFKFSDFPGQAVEFRFVGSPFCHKLHTIYLDTAHAIELRRWRNRDKSARNEQLAVPRDAKAFDVVCPDFDYIDEKSYPNSITGVHSCECCSTYSDYTKERLQYFAWCLYKNPVTKKWVPELKVLRFPKTVAEGIREAAALMEDAEGNVVEDIADMELGGSVIISYTPGAAPAQQYRVNRGNLMPVRDEMRAFVEANIRPLDELYRINMQEPSDISRSLKHWKYNELIASMVPGAPAHGSASFGGDFGGQATSAMPHIASSFADAPPSSLRKAAEAAAPSIPTFGGDDTPPSRGGFGATVPTFGADDSVPSFGSVPTFGAASVPSFMEDFTPPAPPAGRAMPSSGGF
jgi:hypothetical protein